MKEISLVIEGRVPSKKNSKRRIMRGGRVFMVPSEAHEAWHRDASYQIAKFRPERPLERCEVAITIYAADRRRADLTNAAESLMDLLVDNGFIVDDNWFVVGENTQKFGGIDRQRPRAEIAIVTSD